MELVAGVQLRIVIGASQRLHAWGVAHTNDLTRDGLAVHFEQNSCVSQIEPARDCKGETVKIKTLTSQITLISAAVIISNLGYFGHAGFSAIAQQTSPTLNLSPEEQNLVKAIVSAPDPAAKVKASADLIHKYPRTLARPRVARDLAAQIAKLTDASQRLSLAQEYQKVFDEPSEQELILPVLIDAHANANQPDEAFAKGAAFLSQNPDSLRVLVALVSVGAEQAKKKNSKFVAQTIQYGTHTIELIESDKKPADMDDVSWKEYKNSVLPAVYRSMGLLNLLKGDRVQAKTQYTKASELAPSDPFNFLMLSALLNDEYQIAAQKYKGMPEGPAKEAELKKTQTMLDSVIEAYAKTIALSEGNPALLQVRQQYLQDLEAYYRYRHNNSTEGMQQLIDKYKAPAKP